jgi:hypothetical protein
MRGTRIEKEVEICATNLTNKMKYMSTRAKKWEKIFEDIIVPTTTLKNPLYEFFCMVIKLSILF